MSKRHLIILMVLLLGIADSLYLTYVHFVPGSLFCPTIGTAVNCENVLTSSYSSVLGIPLAVLGLGWFVVSLAIYLLKKDRIVKNVWMLFGAGGILYSITAQTILGKVCMYCAALDVLIALSIGMLIFLKL